MAEYSIEFDKELIEAAQAIVDRGENSEDAGRAILYLSLLSCEIILKALLEKAGIPIGEIRKLSHDLSKLLDKLGQCEVAEEIANHLMQWIPATGICGKTIIPNTMFTVGVLLEGESHGASKYPNEIRYGDRIYHFPPVAALKGAKILLDWAHERWDRIRVIRSTSENKHP
jgi:hypothetical protein